MKIRTIVCWLLLAMIAGLVLVLVSPLRYVLHVQGDLSNYVIHLAVMGVPLITLAILTRMSRVLRIFLITTGVSASGWFISLSLHALLSRFFPTEPVTYILVFFVLPVTFLIGVFGATAMGIKQLFSR